MTEYVLTLEGIPVTTVTAHELCNLFVCCPEIRAKANENVDIEGVMNLRKAVVFSKQPTKNINTHKVYKSTGRHQAAIIRQIAKKGHTNYWVDKTNVIEYGLIEKIGPRQYKLTPAGEEYLDVIDNWGGSMATKTVTLYIQKHATDWIPKQQVIINTKDSYPCVTKILAELSANKLIESEYRCDGKPQYNRLWIKWCGYKSSDFVSHNIDYANKTEGAKA